MKPKLFTFLIFFVAKFALSQPQTLLATACTRLATNITFTYYDENGMCNFFVRVGGVPYDQANTICDNAFYQVQGTCQIVMLDSQANVDTFVGRGLLKVRRKADIECTNLANR